MPPARALGKWHRNDERSLVGNASRRHRVPVDIMAEHRFNPEHIIELAEELRLAGFDIGTQQQIAAQDLLIALAAHNRLPADPRDWRSLLAPIFCASPTEQDEFYGRFDQWLDRHPEWKVIEDDLTEPIRREIAIPAGAIHWLRKPVGMVSAALLILLLGFAVFLSLKTNRTLTGQVFSSDGDQANPLPEAQVEFFNQPAAKTDRDGNFTINYQARNWNRIFNRQVADLTVTHGEHDPVPSIKLDVHNPSHQTIKLQKRQPKTSDQTIITLPPTPEATPPPIPLLPEFTTTKSGPTTAPNPIRWYHWLLIASPLILFAGWLMLRWRRRRALLQKLQAAGSPNLRRLTVRGASEHLFQSQMFRRAVQDLRRHRRVEVRDLDIPSTVSATIRRGGMFQPLYGARKALPEYLLLIDRASPSDEQARFADELSHRLEEGGVFVDRFYFQNDPRTCRQRETSSQMVTLLDLAARFPEHQLLIFSDGAGFISPLTGEAEPWVTMFSHWPRRVLLTPELASQPGYRELALAEHDFLVLPANDDGLFVLTETINTGLTPNRKSARNGDDSLFPRLILQERPKRWLERHEPRPAVLDELCAQLKRYLGEDGWHWLAACAVYPALSWDVTLYLGFKLFGDAGDFEERLLRLIRLPWFRYGSMPDWLRLRLIESFTPEQEATVRQTIETMLLTALDHPQEGIPLELAERQPAEENWWQRLKAKWDERQQKRRIEDLIEKEIKDEDSPLNDFVFLGFLSGGRARRLTVKLPELLNSVLFPKGHPVLGLRPTTMFSLALAISLGGFIFQWKGGFLNKTPNQVLTLPDHLKEMVYVSGGIFIMGRNDGDEYERPAHQILVKPFYIDRTEVTNEQYKQFIAATAHSSPSHWNNGFFSPTDAKKPIVNVSWSDANAYAKWFGKRLPTEEEWEYVARGTDGRRYPWGNLWDSAYANVDRGTGGNIAEVGSFPNGATPLGVLDMCGNVWEWTSSSLNNYDGQELIAPGKVIRGGAYDTPPLRATATYRGVLQPDKAYGKTGFRCVKDVSVADTVTKANDLLQINNSIQSPKPIGSSSTSLSSFQVQPSKPRTATPRPTIQSIYLGSMKGIVTNPEKVPISEAKVTAINLQTKIRWTRVTSVNGEFLFETLPVGRYRVTVQKNSCNSYQSDNDVYLANRIWVGYPAIILECKSSK